MDFDEYEYLEKTVESADLAKGANGTASKSKSAEKEKRRTEEKEDAEDGYKSKRHKSLDGERGKSERYADDRDRANKEKSRDRGDRDRDRDRSERSHRDRDKDRDREHRDRDKEKDRDRERERDRDKEKEKDHRDGDRRRRSKDMEREREHERDREREPDKRRRSQSRSRDHEKHEREASRSRDVEKDQRYPREKREKKEEVAEPEADPERDQRTVFAYQISLKADERDVYDFFSRAGKVRDVRLIMDRNTRRSKGVGYIEFYDAMSVPMAIALCGQLLLGQPVMVKPSEAEKNLVPSASTAGSAAGLMGQYPGSARRLYVGNLHYNITEDQLRQVFEPFGAIELVQLPTEPETGHCKGFGFVQYAKLEDARHAQQSLNGLLDLAGRIIKVVPITDQQSMQDPTVAPGELDDDDGGGLSLTARSRTLLMQKLDRTGTVSSIVSTAATSAPYNMPAVAPVISSLGIPGMVGVVNPALGATTLGGNLGTIAATSDCILLKNMFDPATETEPDFDLDIKDEVQSECSKYGTVKHIFVDKNSPGHVYLRFSSIQGAVNAQQSLQGRWFAGKMITVTFLTPQAYETKFPQSK